MRDAQAEFNELMMLTERADISAVHLDHYGFGGKVYRHDEGSQRKEDIQRATNYKEMAKQVLKEKVKEESILQEGVKHASQKL